MGGHLPLATLAEERLEVVVWEHLLAVQGYSRQAQFSGTEPSPRKVDCFGGGANKRISRGAPSMLALMGANPVCRRTEREAGSGSLMNTACCHTVLSP